MKWPRLQEADFSQYEKQIEVVVKGGGGGGRIKFCNEITIVIRLKTKCIISKDLVFL